MTLRMHDACMRLYTLYRFYDIDIQNHEQHTAKRPSAITQKRRTNNQEEKIKNIIHLMLFFNHIPMLR